MSTARKGDLDTVAVLTGGAYSRDELVDRGALAVFDSVEELRSRSDETPLS